MMSMVVYPRLKMRAALASSSSLRIRSWW